MSFKKLQPILKSALEELGYDTPTEFQKQTLSKIKGGANVFGVAPDGSGKTTALILSIVQKLNASAFDDAPRAVVYVGTKQAAHKLLEQFEVFTAETNLRIQVALETHNIRDQIDKLYPGVDIVISTPKHLSKLYFLNGLNLGELQIVAIEDAQKTIPHSHTNEIIRITESLNKCQFIVFADSFPNKVRRFEETFMSNAMVVKVD